MVPQKYLHFLHRFIQMGPRTAIWLLHHRIKKHRFTKIWGKKWLGQTSYHTWQELRRQHNLGSFETFFKALSAKAFCHQILHDNEFITSLPEKLHTAESIVALADQACLPEVRILGYGTFTFSPGNIPWHQDFTAQEASPTAWRSSFFASVTIPSMEHHSISKHYPDIKVPWELSRLQHFFLLGLGYQQAQKEHDLERSERYADSFVQQTDNWLENNPFLQGVNWTNPMEVAIRAINLVWAFHFFKHNSNIPQAFWQRFVCMLHDHALYLEHSWEVSQKPNNHYIADLLGHLYLSTFLVDIPHLAKQQKQTIKKLIGQWRHQILPDGTCYEGSSQYHKLVTEMMMHFLLVCKYSHIELPAGLAKTFTQMKQFLIDCTDQGGNMVLIGDDDSGKIVVGFKNKLSNTSNSPLITYPNFGLSIIKTPNWHVTFRHPTYQNHQPSGHFHQDMLSVTLSIDQIPILVDPGTYVYTGNASWRNHLRSVQSHNNFFLDTELEMPSDLFQLNCLPHAQAQQAKHISNEIIEIQDEHLYCHDYGLIACRKVTLDTRNNMLIITDWWEKIASPPKKVGAKTTWALHFAPDIILEKENETTWCVKKSGQALAVITTTLNFVAKQGWICPEYGSIMQGTILVASYPQTDVEQTVTIKNLHA